jgi:hypothetical protein
MAEIVKFIYVIIIFIFQLLVLREVDGKPFLSFLNFLLYFIHNISSHFNYFNFFYFLPLQTEVEVYQLPMWICARISSRIDYIHVPTCFLFYDRLCNQIPC